MRKDDGLRVRIIGCGGVSAVYAKVIQDLEDATLVACAYIRPGRAKAMAEQNGCTAYEEYRSMLDEATIRLEGKQMEICSGDSIRQCALKSDPSLGRVYWDSGHLACIRDFYRSIMAKEPYANAPTACDITMRTLFALYNEARPAYASPVHFRTKYPSD